MSYTLGLDIGTTTTAAAVNDGSRVSVFTHASGATAIPSVLALDEQGDFLIGDAAIAHGRLEPTAVARESKRRFGDTTPLLLRGTPVAANDLALLLAQFIVGEVTGQIGEAPDQLVVCHPANWGQFKQSLLSDTLSNSSLPPHHLISEPQAAAIHYAGLERVANGTTIGVYDLGGGTFDVAVLRKDDGGAGWSLVGQPGGIERLGGIDFDAALFHHVTALAGIDVDHLDDDDPTTQLSVARLREECAAAKQALSSDNATTIAVSLPDIEETVRVTRAEFEALIGPAINRTLETLDVTVANAGITFADLDRIVLVGGSARIPLVGQRLAAHTGRPIAVDAHPKNAIALGAAALVSPTPQADESSPSPTESNGHNPNDGETIILPRGLGTNFPGVPHMADEPLPDFLTRRQATASASVPEHATDATAALPELLPLGPPPDVPAPAPTPMPGSNRRETATTVTRQTPAGQQVTTTDLGQTQPLPNRPTGPPPVGPAGGQGGFQQIPPNASPTSPKRGRGWLVLVLVLLMVAAGAGLLYQQRRGETASGAVSTETTAEPGSTTSAAIVVDPTEAPAPETNCPDAELPDADGSYRVVEISSDDPDGGLNGRAEPNVTADIILVFASQSPVKVTGMHCHVDLRGRTWWGARARGQLVWVAERYVEKE